MALSANNYEVSRNKNEIESFGFSIVSNDLKDRGVDFW